MRCLCGSEVVVASVALHIPYVQDHLRKDFKVAAQNAWVKGNGAYTGEIRCAQPPAFFLVCKFVVTSLPAERQLSKYRSTARRTLPILQNTCTWPWSLRVVHICMKKVCWRIH